jgi:hypothetical protein
MLTDSWARYRRRVSTSIGAVTARAVQCLTRRGIDGRVGLASVKVPRLVRVAFGPCKGVDHEVGGFPGRTGMRGGKGIDGDLEHRTG